MGLGLGLGFGLGFGLGVGLGLGLGLVTKADPLGDEQGLIGSSVQLVTCTHAWLG